MQDAQIVELYWRREETAIVETDRKYGPYCTSIARNILYSFEDTEECVNDTWLRAWNTMPPQKPSKLQMFLAKITRNLAFDRYKARNAEKRGGGELPLVLSELEECIPAPGGVEEEFMAKELAASVNRFVQALPERDAVLFVRRYFFTESLAAVAARCGISPNNASVILNRTRRKLKAHLEKEGFHP